MYLVIHAELAANNAGIAAIAFLPIWVAQHQNGIRARLVIGISEQPAEMGFDAKQVKEVRRHHASAYVVRLLPAEQNKRHDVKFLDLREGLRLFTVIRNFFNRETSFIAGHSKTLVQYHQLLPLRIRQWFQQDAIDHAEQRCICANAQTESEHRY